MLRLTLGTNWQEESDKLLPGQISSLTQAACWKTLNSKTTYQPGIFTRRAPFDLPLLLLACINGPRITAPPKEAG